ncbi:MAG: FAD binding domain-containing protein [Planctomycetaceae bacterium]
MATEEIFCPDTLESALDLLDRYGPDLLVLAGGTLAMPLVNDGLIRPKRAMTLHRARLNTSQAVDGRLQLGATTTLSRVGQIEDVPLLAEAARQIGGWAVRNMATLGGNLFAPPPQGDVAVALLALDASVRVARRGGARQIPLDQFFTGWSRTALAPNELVTEIEVPRPRGRTAFLKLGRRQANTPAVVTVAVQVAKNEAGICTQARIALGAAGDHPLRARQAEAALQGRKVDASSIADAAALAMTHSQPISDALASAWYRRKMVGVFVRRALKKIG